MNARLRSLAPLGMLVLGCLLLAALYAPGLSGPWLVDDDFNLGAFLAFPPGGAPYAELITSGTAGPLGRVVALASFAANHYFGFFDTFHLKAVNLALHLLNGLLLYWLCLSLFRLRPPLPGVRASYTALGLVLWWLLLPLHTSAVLYIVQRMTLLASFFAIGTCLAYVLGRQRLGTTRGWLLLATSLLVLFPLAVFTKESAFVTLAWLVLIELFFFARPPAWRIGVRPALAGLVALTVLAGMALVAFTSIRAGYQDRDFTLEERLLTQPRVMWSYMHSIFLPDGAQLGLFHDDIPLSRGLLSPATTLLALLGLGGLLAAAIRVADGRGWAIAFGIFFYLAGHLVESTLVPLELYFEHRNYLPSLGLLLAAATALQLLMPARGRLLLVLFALYLALLAFATAQRSHVWADKRLLLEASAHNHPYSMRAWTDYTENLLENRKPREAMQAALLASQNNPDNAAVFYLQMISIYCRIQQPVPTELLKVTAQALQANRNMAGSMVTPLGTGLEFILTERQVGRCTEPEFAMLLPALHELDANLVRHYGEQRGRQWFLRLTEGEWMLALGQPESALPILEDVWKSGDQAAIPTVGLVLAETLVKTGRLARARQVLAELAAVTHDAPQDFRLKMIALQQRASGTQ